MKTWRIILLSICIFPLSFAASIFAFYIRATQQAGQGPAYGQTNPVLLNVYKQYDATIHFTMLAAWFSFFAFPVLLLLYLLVKRKSIEWWLVAAPVVSYVLAWLGMNTDAMEWILD